MSLVVIATHPIQYHVPIYRVLSQEYHIPVTVIYGSDCSISGYYDKEFQTTVAWDTDMLSGYRHIFLTHRIPISSPAHLAPARMLLQKTIQELAPRAVLLSGYSPKFYQIALREALRLRCPILFRAETTDHARARNIIKRWLRDRLLSAFYEQCAYFLYIGSYSRQHYVRLGCLPERLIFSPYCVDVAPFALDDVARQELRARFRKDFSIPPAQLVLLFSGKLSYRKGPDLILEALRQMPSVWRSRVSCVFLGGGELLGRLKRQARRLHGLHAVFAGFQNQKNLSYYYHGADMLILPSRFSETWGLVVNEALHHGLPCVVSDAVGCAPDLIKPGRTGMIFKSGSIQGLIQALQGTEALVGSEDVRRQCREAVNGYSVAAAAEGIAQAYRRALEIRK